MAVLNKSNRGASAQVPPHFKDRVVQRVIEVELGTSKSKSKPQIKLVTEIVSPDTVTVGDASFVIGGQKITYYLGLSADVSPGAKQSPWASTCDFFEKCGLPTEVDTEDPELNKKLENLLNGLTFDNILSSIEDVQTKPDGKGGYTPILDGRGQPVKNGFKWNSFLNGVIGKCEVDANKPY